MARKKSEQPGHAKMLDSWSQPEDAGDPVGCIATTFTFSPVFFETECLARFLGLESDAEDDRLQFLIEQENRMAQMEAACVLVDHRHCYGKRSLRWDLIPARLGADRLMHAKVSVLAWANRVRVLIGSANLTEDGYRRNLEVFGEVDFHEGSESPRRLLSQTVGFLQEVIRETVSAGGPAKERALGLLQRLGGTPSDWGVDENGERKLPVRVFPVFSGIGKRKDVLGQISELWPTAQPRPSYAWILSPFFDPPRETSHREDGPTKEVWGLLKQRGEAGITFTLEAEPIPAANRFHVAAPESILGTGPEAARVRIERIQADGRPLHAKAIWLESARHVLYLMGSSNFTMRGLGLAPMSNIEANLAYVVDFERNKKEGDEFDDCWPEVEDLDLDQVHWRRADELSDEEETVSAISPLPDALGEAIFDAPERKLQLRFRGSLPAGWELFDEEDRWFATPVLGGNEFHELVWTAERPPSGLFVRWHDAAGIPRRSWWPVEVRDANTLPPPEELRDLPLDILIRVLTSAQPLHRVLAAEIRRREQASVEADAAVIDPHKKVDVSAFLLQRSRRFAVAIEAICGRLSKPVPNHQALHWRIHGPVGVRSLMRAVQAEAKSEEERAFLLVELALALAWLRLPQQAGSGMLKAAEVRGKIAEVIKEIRSQLPREGFEGVPNLGKYIEKALEEAKG